MNRTPPLSWAECGDLAFQSGNPAPLFFDGVKGPFQARQSAVKRLALPLQPCLADRESHRVRPVASRRGNNRIAAQDASEGCGHGDVPCWTDCVSDSDW
jgi:hypothetical protein